MFNLLKEMRIMSNKNQPISWKSSQEQMIIDKSTRYQCSEPKIKHMKLAIYKDYKEELFYVIAEAFNGLYLNKQEPVILYQDLKGQLFYMKSDKFHGEITPGVKRFNFITDHQHEVKYDR